MTNLPDSYPQQQIMRIKASIQDGTIQVDNQQIHVCIYIYTYVYVYVYDVLLSRQ